MHGSFGEDGVIQSILSKNNIPFNGSGEKSSRNCFDKSVTKKIVMNQGVLSPKYYQTSSNTCNDHLDFKSEKYLVKPNSQGSSVGFNVIDNFENLNDAIDIALDFDNSVLIEEFIDGREITVPILGNEPLPVIEIEPKSGIYDYKSKYTAGESKYICPADLKLEKYKFVQNCALSIHKMLKCDVYSRVDFKFYNDKIFFSLNTYIKSQLKKCNVKKIEIINKDTYPKKNKFFSSRRSINEKFNDYGRNISVIMIK